MDISKVWTVFFSPTKTTRKVVEVISDSINSNNDSVDLTCSSTDAAVNIGPDELVVIGAPVYSGRVAAPAVERLRTMNGNNGPAVIVVLYGNREYEDALIELRDIAMERKFVPVAAAAFIGEHSFSTPEMPIAEGRPDENDLREAATFGRKVSEKIKQLKDISSVAELQVPGNIPYRDSMPPLPFTPEVNNEDCTLCGLCMESCPSDAISIENEVVMDAGRCIFCCACIKTCPEDAVSIKAAPLLEIKKMLYENYSKRKEPELYY